MRDVEEMAGSGGLQADDTSAEASNSAIPQTLAEPPPLPRRRGRPKGLPKTGGRQKKTLTVEMAREELREASTNYLLSVIRGEPHYVAPEVGVGRPGWYYPTAKQRIAAASSGLGKSLPDQREDKSELTGKDGKDLIPDRSPREVARVVFATLRKAAQDRGDTESAQRIAGAAADVGGLDGTDPNDLALGVGHNGVDAYVRDWLAEGDETESGRDAADVPAPSVGGRQSVRGSDRADPRMDASGDSHLDPDAEGAGGVTGRAPLAPKPQARPRVIADDDREVLLEPGDGEDRWWLVAGGQRLRKVAGYDAAQAEAQRLVSERHPATITRRRSE